MGLWVRSQDKESLIKIEKIELIYDYLCSEDLQLIHIETDKGRIGSYSTKERALEVLDEIQEYINNNCEFIERKSHTKMGTYTNKIQMKVYEMPEK